MKRDESPIERPACCLYQTGTGRKDYPRGNTEFSSIIIVQSQLLCTTTLHLFLYLKNSANIYIPSQESDMFFVFMIFREAPQSHSCMFCGTMDPLSHWKATMAPKNEDCTSLVPTLIYNISHGMICFHSVMKATHLSVCLPNP